MVRLFHLDENESVFGPLGRYILRKYGVCFSTTLLEKLYES